MTYGLGITPSGVAAIEQAAEKVHGKEPRPLHYIAREIRRDWRKVYFGAVPYLDAMSDLNDISDRFYQDDGEMVVAYFLSNATTWKGETARRVKAELKAMLNGGNNAAT